MGCLMRTPDGEFRAIPHVGRRPRLHPGRRALADSYETCAAILDVIDNDEVLLNLQPFCEPRLDRHGLYESLPADADRRAFQHAVQWVLNLCDGRHSLLDIARRAGMDFAVIHDAARRLTDCGLLGRPEAG